MIRINSGVYKSDALDCHVIVDAKENKYFFIPGTFSYRPDWIYFTDSDINDIVLMELHRLGLTPLDPVNLDVRGILGDPYDTEDPLITIARTRLRTNDYAKLDPSDFIELDGVDFGEENYIDDSYLSKVVTFSHDSLLYCPQYQLFILTLRDRDPLYFTDKCVEIDFKQSEHVLNPLLFHAGIYKVSKSSPIIPELTERIISSLRGKIIDRWTEGDVRYVLYYQDPFELVFDPNLFRSRGDQLICEKMISRYMDRKGVKFPPLPPYISEDSLTIYPKDIIGFYRLSEPYWDLKNGFYFFILEGDAYKVDVNDKSVTPINRDDLGPLYLIDDRIKILKNIEESDVLTEIKDKVWRKLSS